MITVGCICIGMHWIFSPEGPASQHVLPCVETILLSPELTQACEPIKFLEQELLADTKMIEKTAKLTIGQRRNPVWCQVRQMRLTASNFGAVIKAINRKRY